jgi:hypothetical protein
MVMQGDARMLIRSFRELLGRKTLIAGDVGSGKTKMAVELLNEAVRLGYRLQITVIDMAPGTTVVKGKKVGGKMAELTDATREVRYLAPERVETPRLSAETPEHLLCLAGLNKSRIDEAIGAYLKKPTKILFVNDISIYFQSGSAEPVLEAAERSETFIANGYYGQYLAQDQGTGVSEVERRLMDHLARHMDEVIRL